MDSAKENKGEVLITSVLLCVLGLLFIDLGLSWLPIIGIFLGVGFLWAGLHPWLNFLHRRSVYVLAGSISDNHLEDKRIVVAILSASKERDGFEFNPAELDPQSVRIGAGNASSVYDLTDPQTYGRSLVDINEDGIPDLVLHFSADCARIDEKISRVCVRAKTREGERVTGCNEISPWRESFLLRKLEYV